QRAMSKAKSTKKIDWSDPSVIRYHARKMKPKTVAQARRNMVKYLKNQGNYKVSDFKGMSYNEIRPIFEKVWDFNQHIEPMEHGSEKMKSPEKIEEEDVDTQKEMKVFNNFLDLVFLFLEKILSLPDNSLKSWKKMLRRKNSKDF
ncbi:hypothetical protein Tco_1374568, partial [Tanacetum coccineum]